jgi:uncharacterized protein
MRTELDHLPETKRRELARVVEILFAEFEAAIAGGTMPYKRQGRILKVVLFGSYGRGDWVEDPVGGYVSDYDLLVLTLYSPLCRARHNGDAERWTMPSIRRDPLSTKALPMICSA